MSKVRRNNHGQTKEQQLRGEISKLKKENSRLSKLLNRLDLSRNDMAREIIEEAYQKEAVEREEEHPEKTDEWKCKLCQDGCLEIIEYTKAGVPYYFRKCNNSVMCKNRTKGQKYHEGVKGLRPKPKG